MANPQLAEAFLDGLAGLDDNDVSDDMLAEARRAGQRFVAARRWAQLTGDRVDTTAVRQRLGITRQALHQRVTSGTILAVPGAGTSWYPTWQFRPVDGSDRLEVRPVVTAVLQRFRDELGDDLSPLTVVSWAATGQPELEGHTPKEWISSGGGDAAVELSANRTAAQLAR